MSASTTREERFAHGLEVLKRVDGEAGQRVVDSLADINPELGHQVVAWAFGDLGYARLVSITTEENTASRNVMAKLGFRLHERIPSEWGELWVHALDRE